MHACANLALRRAVHDSIIPQPEPSPQPQPTMKVIPIQQAASPSPRSGPCARCGARLRWSTAGRSVRDLRISVTDRCNFRCVCSHAARVFGDDYAFLPRRQLLSFEEILRVARLFVGARRAARSASPAATVAAQDVDRPDRHARRTRRRRGHAHHQRCAAAQTRARRLKGRRPAPRHREPLDALDDALFRRMNDADYPVEKVLRGIGQPRAVALGRSRSTMVVKRGTNDVDIEPMAAHFRNSGHILRFIEFMDVGASNGWKMDEVLPSREIVERIDRLFPLEPVDPNYEGEVAERWRYKDGAGEIGVISSVTQAFCSSCTRIRLSTEGQLYTCLFAQQGHDLRALLLRRCRRCPYRRGDRAGVAGARTAIPDPHRRDRRAAQDRDVPHRRLKRRGRNHRGLRHLDRRLNRRASPPAQAQRHPHRPSCRG